MGKKGSREKHYINWENGEEYTFDGIQLTRDDSKSKNVWHGRFDGKAPCGLPLDKTYCVVEILVNGLISEYPQRREYYDVVQFRGNHLRQILARNENARKVEEELSKGALQNRSRICYIVEPAYESTDEWFRECWQHPVADRLDLISQYAEGCLELRSPENRLDGRTVDAHRDLKTGNGLIEMIDGKLRIRLIDFASVHLEKEMDDWAVYDVYDDSDTYGGFLSPSNTAPEDFHNTQWDVGGTTDVYALGMMMASMFMHEDGKYFNPNSKWIGDNPGSEAALKQLDKKFSKQLESYERSYDQAEKTEAWIEKVLRGNNVAFSWEDMPDQEVLADIRKLFVRATRIDPQKRISLENFIQEIREIQKKASESRKRFPVSVYLFEQTDFDKYAYAYEQAATEIFRKEDPASKALCVRYHRLITKHSQPKDAIACQQIPCRNEQDLHSFIKQTSKANGRGADVTALALYLAGCELAKQCENYEFTGNVYLFCPELPRDEQIITGVNGIVSQCSRLNQCWNKQTYIDAFVIQKRGYDDEEESWCTQTQLSYTEPMEHNMNNPETEYCEPGMLPYGKLCITLPDGSVFPL